MKRSRIPYLVNNKKGESKLSCPNCEEMTDYTITQGLYYDEEENRIKSCSSDHHKCNKCGAEFKYPCKLNYKTRSVHLCEVSAKTPLDGSNKVILNYTYVSAIARNTKSGIHEVYYWETIVSNCVTGQSYVLPPRVLGSHAKLIGTEKVGIRNATYGNCTVPSSYGTYLSEDKVIAAVDKYYELMNVGIRKAHPDILILPVDIHCNSGLLDNSIPNMIRTAMFHNRFPSAAIEHLTKAARLSPKVYRKIKNTDIFFPRLLEVTKLSDIPNSIKKVIHEDIDKCDVYKYIRTLTSDVNLQKEMLTKLRIDSFDAALTDGSTDEFMAALKEVCYKGKSEKLGEVTLVRKLLQKVEPNSLGDTAGIAYNEYFNDTAKTYRLLKELGVTPIIRNESLKEIHDSLARLYRRTGKPFVEFSYEDKIIERLEQNIDGYIFRIAKSNYELIDIGEEMNICVGSYGDDVVKGVCTIVSCIKDNKNLVCIEVDGKEDRIEQAKLYKNNRPGGEVKDVLLKWADTVRLDTRCYDLGFSDEPVYGRNFNIHHGGGIRYEANDPF